MDFLKIGPFENLTFWKLDLLKIGPFKNWTTKIKNNVFLIENPLLLEIKMAMQKRAKPQNLYQINSNAIG